jgi:hypothetical protein
VHPFRIRYVLAALVVLSTSACGGQGSEFIGLWTSNGTFTASLSSTTGTETRTAQVASESREILFGATSDIIIGWDRCHLPANADGETASVLPGFVCSVPYEAATVDLTFATGTAVKSKNAIQFVASGTSQYSLDGSTYRGTFTIQETFTKLSR